MIYMDTKGHISKELSLIYQVFISTTILWMPIGKGKWHDDHYNAQFWTKITGSQYMWLDLWKLFQITHWKLRDIFEKINFTKNIRLSQVQYTYMHSGSSLIQTALYSSFQKLVQILWLEKPIGYIQSLA